MSAEAAGITIEGNVVVTEEKDTVTTNPEVREVAEVRGVVREVAREVREAVVIAEDATVSILDSFSCSED